MQAFQALRSAQDKLAELLGCEPARRSEIVAAMLHRSPREITGYWLQLLIATGIATLGLAMGSTAVVIGAMLVAPLMGPIIGLGMGLAIGSPALVVRAAVRVGASIAAVVVASAGLVRLLPFREVNAEIAARTTPTALDLGVAMFCAIVGVYASLRPGSDIATTAAGTSIGISLVPPLCVTGYGIGTSGWALATGAALLFLTNFAAIVTVGTLSFAATGFAQVDVAQLGEESGSRLSKWLQRSRAHAWPIRLAMPLLLLAALYAPLRRGLDAVAWQIRARANVEGAVASLPSRVVQARVRVERREVEVVIFLLGSPADARSARASLVDTITRETGVTPRVDVFSVPDSVEFEALEQAVHAVPPVVAPPPSPAPEPSPPPPPPPPPLSERLASAHREASEAIDALWPETSAGSLLRVDLSGSDAKLVLSAWHLGAELGAAATEALQRGLQQELGIGVLVLDRAIESAEIELSDPGLAAYDRVSAALEAASSFEHLKVCVTEPQPKPSGARARPNPNALEVALAEAISKHPARSVVSGERWTVRVALDCGAPPT